MIMSPLFKEETSFTILHKSGYLDSVQNKTILFFLNQRDTVTTRQQSCYLWNNSGNGISSLQLLSTKSSSKSQIMPNGICVLCRLFQQLSFLFQHRDQLFQQRDQLFQQRDQLFQQRSWLFQQWSSAVSATTARSQQGIYYLRSLTCVSNNALQ